VVGTIGSPAVAGNAGLPRHTSPPHTSPQGLKYREDLASPHAESSPAPSPRRSPAPLPSPSEGRGKSPRGSGELPPTPPRSARGGLKYREDLASRGSPQAAASPSGGGAGGLKCREDLASPELREDVAALVDATVEARTPWTLNSNPQTLHSTRYSLNHTPHTLHRTPYIINPTPHTPSGAAVPRGGGDRAPRSHAPPPRGSLARSSRCFFGRARSSRCFRPSTRLSSSSSSLSLQVLAGP